MLESGFQSTIPRPAAPAAPREYVRMQIIQHYLRTAESENFRGGEGVITSNLCFSSPLGDSYDAKIGEPSQKKVHLISSHPQLSALYG